MELLTHHRGTFNGVELHWAEQGDGPPVVLLHGFPEFWYGWRKQLPFLAGHGYRAIAPDLRGYNGSDKPPAVRDYDIRVVADDIIAFIEALGEPVVLAGHDWGGAIAWRIARVRPALLRGLVILNVPHPRAITECARRSPRQLLRLWYQLAMQPPALPEKLLRANRYALLRRVLKSAATSTLSDDEISHYVEAWSRPGALSGMVNYYRALLRRSPEKLARDATPHEAMRTLLIWGEQDPVFLKSTAAASREFSSELQIEWIPEAGHFVQWDAPERVNELLLGFLECAAPAALCPA